MEETMKELSKCEQWVLSVICRARKDITMPEVMNKVNKEYGKVWKPQTFATFLTRMTKKGYLTSYRKGRYVYYKPLVSADAYAHQLMDDYLKFCKVAGMSAGPELERLIIDFCGLSVPRKLCTIDRYGEADDCEPCPGEDGTCDGECDLCPVQECFTKLAAYEATGLSPEQVVAMDSMYREKCEELNRAEKAQR